MNIKHVYFFWGRWEKNRQAKWIAVKLRGVEDGAELGFREVAVLRVGQLFLEFRHAVEVAKQYGTVDAHRIEARFFQFAQEAAIATIDGITDTPEIFETVVGGAAVDMVDGHTGRDWSYPRDIHGSRSEDAFPSSESMSELEILIIATTLTISTILHSIRINQHFLSVRIHSNTDDASVSVIDIERDVRYGVNAHEFDEDIVVIESATVSKGGVGNR